MTRLAQRSRGGRIATALLAMVLLVACSASPSPSFEPADCAQPDASGVVNLKAEDLEFNFPCIAVPENTAFTIRLENLDSDAHNVSIYDTSAKGTDYLIGDTIGLGESIDYPVAALSAGEYYFDCIVHPEMNGPLFVLAND